MGPTPSSLASLHSVWFSFSATPSSELMSPALATAPLLLATVLLKRPTAPQPRPILPRRPPMLQHLPLDTMLPTDIMTLTLSRRPAGLDLPPPKLPMSSKALLVSDILSLYSSYQPLVSGIRYLYSGFNFHLAC